MSRLTVYLDAIGLCGPGLQSWATTQEILRGTAPYEQAPTEIAPSDYLPAAERRRVGTAVKLALAAAKDALSASPYDASQLLSVFSSSGGDGDNCHIICEALASSDRMISPTRFTNSVHNAPSGYWGIALKAKPASTSLCAFDGSFSTGLLEAATQAISAKAPVLLIAYDTPYPEPLRAVRPIAHSMGVALVISPQPTSAAVASIELSLGKGQPTTMTDARLEALRINVPAARCLPLLRAIACGQKNSDLVLDLFDNQQLLVRIGDTLGRRP
jgi:Beta-ketoacyl synthase, N-terminal domain